MAKFTLNIEKLMGIISTARSNRNWIWNALPSGKYKTNGLVFRFGVFVYNLLRLIGQERLKRTHL